MSPIITAADVSKTYGTGTSAVTALSGVNLAVAAGVVCAGLACIGVGRAL